MARKRKLRRKVTSKNKNKTNDTAICKSMDFTYIKVQCVQRAHMVATEVVHGNVHGQLISCDVTSELDAEKTCLGNL
jgi:hypothetical protein